MSKEKDDENVDWKLNLSQAQKQILPRVHWATSPFSKGANPPSNQVEDSSEGLKEKDLTFGHTLKARVENLNERSNLRKSKLPNALSGLLRSKSTSCSPTSTPRTKQSKITRYYASPLSSRAYVATDEPSSSSQPDPAFNSPLRKSPNFTSVNPREVADVEEVIGGLGSSFFSENDMESKQVELLGLMSDDFDSDLFDFADSLVDALDPIPSLEIPSAGPIHRRLLITKMERFAGHVQLVATDLSAGAREVTVNVSGEWLKCLPKSLPPDRLIVHAVFETSHEYLLSDEKGFLIIFPDTLVSATAVADSITCSRRAVLSARTQASVEDNKPSSSLISGSVVHEIVEKTLESNCYDSAFISGMINFEVSKHLLDLFCAEIENIKVINEVKSILESFPEWATEHLPSESRHLPLGGSDDVLVEKVLKVEESVWSHAFGLKGKIDATVLVKCPEDSQKLYLCPFELKTSNSTSSVAHRAQTLLYGLMLWDRYRVRPESSLLFYVAKGKLFRLQPTRTDIRALVMTRNRLAAALESPEMPDIIRNEHLCRKCHQLENCTLYRRVVEAASADDAPNKEYYMARTSHLTNNPKHFDFFKKWERLVWLEEIETTKSRREMWSRQAQQRYKSGQCIPNLVLETCDPVTEPSSFSRYTCLLKLSDQHGGDLQNTQISDGDPVVVSAMLQPIFGLAIGFVKSISDSHVCCVLDRPLSVEADVYGNKIEMFRVDKDELSSGFGLLRTNLLKLFVSEQQRLMQLIVEDVAPEFNPTSLSIPFNLSGQFSNLDSCQQDVVKRVLEMRDYLLVLGMPGTGKSTTLAFVIKLLVSMGKSVLLSSHTHSAVDNILLKLGSWEGRFVRIGNPDKIEKALHHSVLETQKFQAVGEIESFFMNAQLVACTCLSANHQIFRKRRFDVCIVDEASQISVPACIGPLRLSDKFVLVGDHFQLPPLVRSKVAVAERLNQSLFSMLGNQHPEAMSMLRLQYRMNEEIMAISNKFVYQNMLECGSEIVAKSKFHLPLYGAKSCDCISPCWLDKILDPNRSVLFVDTDICGAVESPVGNSYQNQAEAQLIHQIIRAMLSCGASAADISLISPFRPQLRLLQLADYPQIEVATVDRFQGLDAQCIIISLVRSNHDNKVGQLLKDWNRLNVAFTRAKCKLILVGSLKTLSSDTSMADLLQMFRERDWLIRAPKDHRQHSIP